MRTAFRPSAGQVVMVEALDEPDPSRCLTGVVMPGSGPVAIDIGSTARAALADGAEVIVSVFSAEAMYRIRALAVHAGTGLISLDPTFDVERVQRRRCRRKPIRLSVTLVAVADEDPEVARVAGRSVDVGAGGLRVETVEPLPEGAQPLAILSAPHGSPLMLSTRVVSADVGGDGCVYRLAFTQLRPSDADRIAGMLGRD